MKRKLQGGLPLAHLINVRKPGLMILLIRLYAATRHITAEILRNAGYRVEEAGDGEEALRLLNIHQFELIVLAF
jgi:CheY-like chemotaxis protein